MQLQTECSQPSGSVAVGPHRRHLDSASASDGIVPAFDKTPSGFEISCKRMAIGSDLEPCRVKTRTLLSLHHLLQEGETWPRSTLAFFHARRTLCSSSE